MAGPASLVRSAELVLRGLGVETSLIPAANRRRGLRVLLLGHSFVVARHFEFAKPA